MREELVLFLLHSISQLVASMDSNACVYRADARVQKHRKVWHIIIIKPQNLLTYFSSKRLFLKTFVYVRCNDLSPPPTFNVGPPQLLMWVLPNF